MNIGSRGFGGKKLSNKRRKKRGNKFVPATILLAISMTLLYFFFYSQNNETTETEIEEAVEQQQPEQPEQTVQTTQQVPTTPTTVAAAPTTLPEIIKKVTPQERAILSSLYQKSKSALSRGELLIARELAQTIMNKVPQDSLSWNQAASILSQANTLIFSTDYIAPEKQNHIVKTGDSLDKIVKNYCTTLEAIQKSNNLPSTSSTIRLGQSLTVFKGDWLVKISKSKYKLYLYNKNKLFKTYNIATGKGNKTPEGRFVIAAKIKEPEWTNKGVKYPFGDPENVLGTRWMKLRAAKTNPNKHLTGYGIHGTWKPESIGKMASNGCIRMKNEDIEELFAIIPKYTNPDGTLVPVIIEK